MLDAMKQLFSYTTTGSAEHFKEEQREAKRRFYVLLMHI